MRKARIDVSPEMSAFVGPGAVEAARPSAHSVGLSFRLGEGAVGTYPDPDLIDRAEEADLVFVVSATACRRLFGRTVTEIARWHLPSELRLIGLAIRDCAAPPAARATLQLAKCIELLCELLTRFADNALLPIAGDGALSERDAARVVAARRLIDERWHEKLTLEAIARACGLNRAKLTRGFRAMFGCSIADMLAEQRLAGARRLLLASDLPVSSIGYSCGYLNNASFTRAFSRRFGVAPTQLRQLACGA